jgi:hypothetical protein
MGIYIIATALITGKYERFSVESSNPHILIIQRLRARRFANNQLIWLFGWHFAMALLTAGLWLILHNRNSNIFVIFLTCISGGLVISRLLFGRNRVHLLGIVSLAAPVGVSILKNWNIPWGYFAVIVGLYSLVVLGLLGVIAAENELGSIGTRLVVSFHFTLIFWAGGMLIDIDSILMSKQVGTTLIYAGIIILGLAAGCAVPFLLFRVPAKISRPDTITERRTRRRR